MAKRATYIVSIGEKYGRWTVLDNNVRYGGRVWCLCRCDCGKTGNIRRDGLRHGKSRSCGCYQRDSQSERNRKEFGEGAFNAYYASTKSSAKKRGLVWEIDKDFVRQITKSDCLYCGTQPSQHYKTRKNYGGYIYNGIDRFDNSVGYVEENCVPCCMSCNERKRAWTPEQFRQWVVNVYRHWANPS